MTPKQGVTPKALPTNWRNFDIGCRFAVNGGVSTVILTGKGEPSLFPADISSFLKHLRPYNFPFVELQTNGIVFYQQRAKYERLLKEWYKAGLTTVSISVVHYDDTKNQAVFQPDAAYMKLVDLIDVLHQACFSVRLSCTMLNGYMDSAEEAKRMIDFSRSCGVEQLSLRELAAPAETADETVSRWVVDHRLSSEKNNEIKQFVQDNGVALMKLFHSAVVYDVKGQNVCLTNALTHDASSDEMRQLIFFPDGHLRYDWQYSGAILL